MNSHLSISIYSPQAQLHFINYIFGYFLNISINCDHFITISMLMLAVFEPPPQLKKKKKKIIKTVCPQYMLKALHKRTKNGMNRGWYFSVHYSETASALRCKLRQCPPGAAGTV